MRRRSPALLAGIAALVTAGAAGVVAALPASAAVGCSVQYSVVNQWPGGFGTNVVIRNIGDPISSWTVVWSYAAGQQVTQYWNATITQSGSQVTARNVSYNGNLATNATTSFGFNGSWNNSSNPAPTSFTLNGTACTGGVSNPTTTTTTRPGTTTTTRPPTTTTTRPPTTPGIPSDAVWVASGQWDTWNSNGYTVYNNIWGGGAGTQTIWARTPTNWGVIANHPMTSGVKSYPHTVRGSVNRTVSSLSTLTTSFNVTVPGSGNYATTYDIWANNWAYEVMLWMNWNGAVGPIAEQYDANGAVPAFRNVSLGGHTWNIYRGSNGANAVFSFLRTSQTNSGTIDVRAILNWLRTQGWWGDVNVGEVQFGFEISGTNGSAAFTDNSFSVAWS
jgi:hypothetical protein